MKHLPRALNRTLLFFFGLFTLASGIGIILLATWTDAKDFWQQKSSFVLEQYTQLTDRTRTAFNPDISWLTIGFTAIAILFAIVMLMWIFRQIVGSTKKLDFQDSQSDNGTTIASIKFADALVEDVIGEDQWVISTRCQSWKVKRHNGLSIKVVTVKGADPKYLKKRMDEVVARLDSALGKEIPVCIILTTGWKTSFTKPDRVK